MINLIFNYLHRFKKQMHGMGDSVVNQLVGPFLLLILLGTFTYSWLEGWSLLDSLYAIVITITTVGYGDLSPQTPAGRAFAIVFTLVAIGLAGYAISTMAAVAFERQAEKQKQLLYRRRMEKINALTNHYIICGATVHGHRTCAEMQKRGIPYVIVEENRAQLHRALLFMHEGYLGKLMAQFQYTDDSLEALDEENMSVEELAADMNVNFLLSDPLNERTLVQAGINRAAGLITSMADDLDNVAVILSARDIVPKMGNHALRIVSRVSDQTNWRRLYLAGANKVVSGDALAGLSTASHMLDPEVAELWDSMVMNTGSSVRMMTYPIAEHPALIGSEVGSFKKTTGKVLVAIKRAGEFMFGPEPEEAFLADDVVLVVGEI